MTKDTLGREAYLERLLAAPHPGTDKVLAFYDHRVGAVCTDASLMLLPLDDHLVHRGDGVFETLKYIDGKLYQLEPHINRMKRSSKAIYLDPPCSWDEVAEIVQDVCRAGELRQGNVRILLGRGPGGFGISPYECPEPSLYIVAYKISPKPEEVYEKGATAFRTTVPAKQSYMARIKSTDYLPNMLIVREAHEKGMDFGLCFDDHGFLAEGSTENVCLVDAKGRLVVPEFTNALAGTTLLRAVELLGDEVMVLRRNVRESEIYDAKELMVVGTTLDVLPLVRFNGRPIHDVKPGPVGKRMRELLQHDLQENGIPLFD
ncbi:aminotransferase class IV [Oceanidesulfovibrio marinus]|uniref:Aminodeoxychorismate lyase n=1 Tax=Oceanidesulfovibrio marinus TaxID=370038 RepID=A0ABX6NFM4_9BACT|nr:aminotransferase class IV [Oceanidesulfovibrio marinus]QJT09026.1 aminodeoxychorismate lyase [Oceanidesulfovibrio marinus]